MRYVLEVLGFVVIPTVTAVGVDRGAGGAAQPDRDHHGTMAGVVGGVVREVLTAEIPPILRRGELYASAAVAGTTLYPVLQSAGVARDAAALAGMISVAALRVAAVLWGLHLPVFHLRDGGGPK